MHVPHSSDPHCISYVEPAQQGSVTLEDGTSMERTDDPPLTALNVIHVTLQTTWYLWDMGEWGEELVTHLLRRI